MPAVERSHRGSTAALVATAVLACTSTLAAVVVWGTRGDAAPTPLPTPQTHRLSADQAACLRFGLVMRRSDALQLTLGLGRYQGLDPGVVPALDDEVDALDAIAADYPDADRALVRAFDLVAYNGAAVLGYDDQFDYRRAVTDRSAATAAAAERCDEIAGFDVERLQVREAGGS